ncbi:MAG: hypothetical protein ACRDWB_04385 [Acidimicrobiales bacterium]
MRDESSLITATRALVGAIVLAAIVLLVVVTGHKTAQTPSAQPLPSLSHFPFSAAPGSSVTPSTSPPPPPSTAPVNLLVGTFLGPYLGYVPSSCGNASTELTLNADSTYSVTSTSSCGDLTTHGTFTFTYTAASPLITFNQQGSSCGTCAQQMSSTLWFVFIDNNTLDLYGTTLHRQ